MCNTLHWLRQLFISGIPRRIKIILAENATCLLHRVPAKKFETNLNIERQWSPPWLCLLARLSLKPIFWCHSINIHVVFLASYSPYPWVYTWKDGCECGASWTKCSHTFERKTLRYSSKKTEQSATQAKQTKRVAISKPVSSSALAW
jgi:hypothetical protein